MKLAVRQFGELVGWLESTADRGIVFRYAEEYLERPGARSLSFSLPLGARTFSQAQAMPFFAGLLPDGETRRRIAEYLHVSEASTLRLLEALGGECAGTVSLEPEEGEGVAASEVEGYEELGPVELSRMMLEAERIPLLVPRGGARLSLAGAQEKIPLLRRGKAWYRPIGGAPSSHLLKPASILFPDIVAVEFASMRLAAALGIPVPEVELAEIGRPVLIVERYDRVAAANGEILRLRQEDSCQALGIMPDKKYQADGGPGFADLARLVKRSCTAPLEDIGYLIDIALFNFLLGNCDAHGKNFSLLHRGDRIGLAPFYDLVATTAWPELDTRLSMRLGDEYRLDGIIASDMDGLARDLGVKPSLIRERASVLAASAPGAWDIVRALPELLSEAELLNRMRAGLDERAERMLKKA
jgi:serine/threonine-protein kinase HipA